MFQDVGKFVKNSNDLLLEELGVDTPPNDPYFVDFLQDSPEPTGEEPEGADVDAPKIYKLVREGVTARWKGLQPGGEESQLGREGPQLGRDVCVTLWHICQGLCVCYGGICLCVCYGGICLCVLWWYMFVCVLWWYIFVCVCYGGICLCVCYGGICLCVCYGGICLCVRSTLWRTCQRS